MALTLFGCFCGCGGIPSQEQVAVALYRLGEAAEEVIAQVEPSPQPLPDGRCPVTEVRAERGSAAWAFTDEACTPTQGQVVFSAFSLTGATTLQGSVSVTRAAPGVLTLSTRNALTLGEVSARIEADGLGVTLAPGPSVVLSGAVVVNEKRDKVLTFAGEAYAVPTP
ncbi:MAG TPA: hypothetical protein VEY30_04875 [Myxococcaceae bacterium]|nr:hypothetical protein [Myxococcaceae bacterium]